MQLKDLEEAFGNLPDGEAKLNYLIELGSLLPELPVVKRTDGNKIKGCSSQVWIAADERGGRLYFHMASDAKIVGGILFILHALLGGKTRGEIKNMDVEKVFEDLGLSALLSSQRQVGLKSAIAALRGF